MTNRHFIRAGSAFLTLAVALAAAPAAAQDAAPGVEEDDGAIVVTAQRREERLIDVPVSIAAIGEDRITATGARDVGGAAPVGEVARVGELGRFVGTRTGDTIWVSFVHVLVSDGTVVTGNGESELERTDDGRIRLVEHYEMHDLPQLSVCEEVAAA